MDWIWLAIWYVWPMDMSLRMIDWVIVSDIVQYIKWWSFLEIIEIEMESEWINECNLMMYDMSCLWCVGITFSGKKTCVEK